MTLPEALRKMYAPEQASKALERLMANEPNHMVLPAFKQICEKVLQSIKENAYGIIREEDLSEVYAANEAIKTLTMAAELVGILNLPDVDYDGDYIVHTKEAYANATKKFSEEVYNLALNSLTPNNQ